MHEKILRPKRKRGKDKRVNAMKKWKIFLKTHGAMERAQEAEQTNLNLNNKKNKKIKLLKLGYKPIQSNLFYLY